HRIEEPEARFLGGRGSGSGKAGEAGTNLRHDGGDIACLRSELGDQRGGVTPFHVGAQHLYPRPEGGRPVTLVATPDEGLGSGRGGIAGQLLCQPGFPDPVVADEQDDPPVASAGGVERGAEAANLGSATDEGDVPAGGGPVSGWIGRRRGGVSVDWSTPDRGD